MTAEKKMIMDYINRISHCCTVVYNARLRKEDLRKGQHPYIQLICRNPGITQEQITRQFCVNPSSVTRQLSALEKKGLIQRTQDQQDRRVWHVYPTEAMQTLLPAAQTAMSQWNDSLLSAFSQSEQELLFSLLERLQHQALSITEQIAKGEKR